jgi:murein DD-endopeptidase MepM/ murein hydrolase activator NlpD
MMSRRAVLAGGAALSAAPLVSCASFPRISLDSSLAQGSLIVGSTVPGAVVTIDERTVSVSSRGYFAGGIAWDRTELVRIAIAFPSGALRRRRILPLVRRYETETINGLPPETVEPPPETLERIRRESALIEEARWNDSAEDWFVEPFDWPAPGIVSGVFGSRRIDNGKLMAPHMGVDIANAAGTPIRAPADAAVLLSDDHYLNGGFTLLDHGHGVSTNYLHQSKRFVRTGDTVRRGDVIGLMGQTGRATGPHLHWGMNWFQVRLDPSLSTLTPSPPRT